MFFKSQTVEAPSMPVVVERPKPETREIEIPDDYLSELRNMDLPIPREVVESWCIDQGIPVYDYVKVSRYLNSLYQGEDKWAWKPIIVHPSSEIGHKHLRSSGEVLDWYAGLYKKPVPLPVILRLKQIKEEFPNISAYVSDELDRSDIADPFLAIWTRSFKLPLVVECWDEPGFDRKEGQS